MGNRVQSIIVIRKVYLCIFKFSFSYPWFIFSNNKETLIRNTKVNKLYGNKNIGKRAYFLHDKDIKANASTDKNHNHQIENLKHCFGEIVIQLPWTQ